MKRIAITDAIDALALKFQGEMLYKRKQSEVSKACKNLQGTIAALQKGALTPLAVTDREGKTVIYAQRNAAEIIAYVCKIKSEYKQLLVLHPSEFIKKAQEYEAIIGSDEMARIELLKPATGEKVALYKLLVQNLRYEHVQSRVFPDIIRALGIKTCVYCNSQYAITTRNNEALYQLDHCLPKSKYPYLSTSFFNLQPCCGSCNLRKSDNDMRHGDIFATIWREAHDPAGDYFIFRIEESSLTKFQLTTQKDDLDIEFRVIPSLHPDIKAFHRDYNEYFKVGALYAEHKDVAQEIIWKKYCYSEAYLKSLYAAFRPYSASAKSDFPRFVMGNYMTAGDVFKRPLSKLMQDLAQQLHIAVEPFED